MDGLSISGSMNFDSAVSMVALAVVSVALRFVIRLSARLPITRSDWLILVALAMDAVYSAIMIDYVVNGPGPRTLDMNEVVANLTDGGEAWGKALLKMLYISDIFFGLTITFVKLSILAFYYTIFSISRKFQLWTYVVGGLCTAWLIVYMFINIFQCKPIEALWEQLGSTEYCIQSGPLWLGYELTNFFLDVLVLVLPVAMVRRLQLPSGQKWSVAGIFLLGGLVCVTSIIRLTFIWHPDNPDFTNIAGTEVMSSIQLGTAILCACLPTYGPMLNVFRKGINKIKRKMGMSTSGTYDFSRNSRARGLVSKDSANRDLEASPYYLVERHGSTRRKTEISNGDGDSLPLADFPSNSIMVQKSVDVV
ncbi:hypothetical protein F4677DRAFT_321439 [Hypoxylon crocopeplum]|nr:hypothetical protein F4677DRAFT_321439 [Hypoxylon crocopeplum]